MRSSFICAVLLSVVTVPAAVSAQTAPAAAAIALKSGTLVSSSDGKKVGRVDRVQKAKDGTPLSVGIIFDTRFVYVPVSTLSTSDKGLVTSLTLAQVKASS